MKLLIVTQSIDEDNPVLGFFVNWVREFAKHYEKLTVICLEMGEYRLPVNVKVLSLGKEKKHSRLRYIAQFYKYIWQERKNYNAVFIHMNQEYVLLGWKFWKLWGKKIFLWRNHAKGSFSTRMAVLLSDKVFCTSPSSYTARFKKTQIMPVGIDTDFFKPDPTVSRERNHVLFLGRISPVKKVLEFIDWVKDKGFVATIAGPILAEDKEYGELVLKSLTPKIKYIGSVTQDETLRLYQSHETYVNFTPAGSMDKTIIEAAACGAKLEVRNPDLKDFRVENHSLKLLIDKLNLSMHVRKKVVFAINNLGIGGGENMLVEQVKCIDRNHFEPYVITILPNPKVNVIDNLPKDIKFLEFNFTSLLDLRAWYKLWAFLRREKIDAIVTCLFDTNLLTRTAAILARVPVIISYEHNIYENKKSWQITADRLLAHFTKKILVGSSEVLEFTSKQERLPKSKFQLNFNSIPLKFGEVKRNRSQVFLKYGLSEDQVYIVTAGSLTPQKGQTYLIDAIYEIKQRGVTGFKTLIFGKGVLKDELSSQIKRLDLTKEVKLMGIGLTEEIMAISDIFTLPSLWEGLSIALLEAMDAGCPIVATKISGTNEALENEVSALLVNPGESSELATAFQRLISDKELREKLADGAKEQVKKFSIEKNVKVIENLILSG